MTAAGNSDVVGGIAAPVHPTALRMAPHRSQVILLQSLVSIVLSYQILFSTDAVLPQTAQEYLCSAYSRLWRALCSFRPFW